MRHEERRQPKAESGDARHLAARQRSGQAERNRLTIRGKIGKILCAVVEAGFDERFQMRVPCLLREVPALQLSLTE